MLNYIYYRAYSFYKKNGLAFDPHTWATVIPTFMISSLLYALYYIGVRKKIFPWMQGSFIFYAVFLLGLGFIMDKAFRNKINTYNRRWDKETGTPRMIKGILVAIIAVASFLGVFIFANEVRKLKP
jgi:hypothetical protein